MYCIVCKDHLDKSCKNCGCRICGGKDDEDKQLMCDECNHPFHMECLTPPVKVIPTDDEWLVTVTYFIHLFIFHIVVGIHTTIIININLGHL